MFNKNDMGVIDWYIFWFLMIIPGINIVVFLVVLLSSNTNKSLRNMVVAAILPIVLIVVLGFSFGLFATIANAV